MTETLLFSRSRKTSINYVQLGDRDKILQFFRAAHNESIVKNIPFSDRKFVKLFQEIIRNPEHHLGLKAQPDDQILCVLHCSLGEYFVRDDARVASVTMLNIDKNVRSTVLGGRAALRLVRQLEKWVQIQICRLYPVLCHLMGNSAKDGSVLQETRDDDARRELWYEDAVVVAI